MYKASILIVEDEAIIGMELKSKLQNLGYEVISVVNTAEEAINKAEADKPDLILMDIRIKGEMDGIDTAEVIRKQFGIPVVFSTAYLDEERIERAKITMPFGYVLKPFQERDLKVTIEKALTVSKVDAERRKIEEAFKESEEKYRNILESIGEGYIENDLKGNYVFCNDAYCKIIGYTRNELLEKSYKDVTDLKNGRKLFQFYNTIYKTGKSDKLIDREITKKNGEKIFVESSVCLIKNIEGEPTGFMTVVRDITGKKEKERELKETEHRLQTIFDTSPVGIQISDPTGKITYSNKFHQQIHERAEEEIVGSYL